MYRKLLLIFFSPFVELIYKEKQNLLQLNLGESNKELEVLKVFYFVCVAVDYNLALTCSGLLRLS